MHAPTVHIATLVDTCVASTTIVAGPTMNDNSVVTESRASAVRRWSTGTSAVSDCRTTEKIGSPSSPPITARTRSTG